MGKELEAMGNQTDARLKFTAQSWIVSLFLDCPKNYEASLLEGLLLTFLQGVICPNATEVQWFQESVQKGWITWHAFPFNAEPELLNPEMLGLSLQLTHDLDKKFGLPLKKVMSQRDVPGTSRSIIPLLKANGVSALSVGVNGGRWDLSLYNNDIH